MQKRRVISSDSPSTEFSETENGEPIFNPWNIRSVWKETSVEKRNKFGLELQKLLNMYEKRKNTPKERRVLYGITQQNVYNKVQKKQEKM